MISNSKQIKITENAYLDVTCDEWERGRQYYGQVARGRPFGTWAAGWANATPTQDEVAAAVAREMGDSTVVVERMEFESFESPVFIFAVTPKAAEAKR